MDLTDFDIIEEFYDRHQNVRILMVQRKGSTETHLVGTDYIWTNENHNQIMDYLQSKRVHPDRFRVQTGYMRVRFIMIVRKGLLRTNQFAHERYDSGHITAEELREEIEYNTENAGNPETWVEVDNLLEKAATMMLTGSWEEVDDYVRWCPPGTGPFRA
jgi:hypothetical protein